METKLSQLVNALGVSQKELADELGSSSAVISQLMNGSRKIGMTIIGRIKARYPNVDVNCFFVEDCPLFIDENTIPTMIPPKKKECVRCAELESIVADQRETISVLRQTIENNNLLFDSMRNMIKK